MSDEKCCAQRPHGDCPTCHKACYFQHDFKCVVNVMAERDRLNRILRATLAGLMGLDDGRTFEGSVDFMEHAPSEALGQHKMLRAAEEYNLALKQAATAFLESLGSLHAAPPNVAATAAVLRLLLRQVRAT